MIGPEADPCCARWRRMMKRCLVLVAGLTATLMVPGIAQAATCAFGAGTMTVTLVANETATVSRSGTALTLNGVSCAGLSCPTRAWS